MQVVIEAIDQAGIPRVYVRQIGGKLTASLLFDILADLCIGKGDIEITKIYTKG